MTIQALAFRAGEHIAAVREARRDFSRCRDQTQSSADLQVRRFWQA